MQEGGVAAESADSGVFYLAAPEFKPGADAFDLPSSPSAFPADGDFVDKTTWQAMYNQLLHQYNLEVPYLRLQVVELTSKLAEHDRWKQQTMSLVRDLRDQHRALRRTIGYDPPAPMHTQSAQPAAPSEQKLAIEAHAAAPAEAEAIKARPSSPTASPPLPTSMMIYDTKMDGVDAKRCEWKVNHFFTKLRGAMGQPVVSAPFDLFGMEGMRMMITPQQQESNTGPRSRKEKEQFSKMVTDGPCLCCLTLKVPNSCPVRLKYQMLVGDKVSMVHQCDFSNAAIDNKAIFKHVDGSIINWLSEMKDSSIIVGVEMQCPDMENADVVMTKENKDEEMLLPK